MINQPKPVETTEEPKASTLVLPSEALTEGTIYERRNFILDGMILGVYIDYKDDKTQDEIYVGQDNGMFKMPPDPRELPVNVAFAIPAESILHAFELYEEYGNMALDVQVQNQVAVIHEMIAAEQERQRTKIVTPGEMMAQTPPQGPRPIM